MANHGLTPEQFEILFGDTIRREIEIMAAQQRAQEAAGVPADPAAVPSDPPGVPPAATPTAPVAPTPEGVPQSPPARASAAGTAPFAPEVSPAPITPPAPEVVPPSPPAPTPAAAAAAPFLAPEVSPGPTFRDVVVPEESVAAPVLAVETGTVPAETVVLPEIATADALRSEELVEHPKPVGPIDVDPIKPRRRWLTGVLAVLAMVGVIALAGFVGFQRANSNTEVAGETATTTAEEVAEAEQAEDVGDDAGSVEDAPDEGVADPGDAVDETGDDPDPADEAAVAEPADADGDPDPDPDDAAADGATATDTTEADVTDTEPAEAEPAEAAPAETEATTTTTTPTTTTSIPPAAAAGSSLIGSVTGTSVCQDPAGDVVLELEAPTPAFDAPDAVDLVSVELTVSATQVIVRFQTAGQVPANFGQAGESPVEVGSYTVMLWSEDPGIVSAEEPIRRVNLIADLDFGEVTAFVTGTGPSLQNNRRDGEIAFDGDSIVITFAVGDLGVLPGEFNWTATARTGVVDNPADPGNFAVALDSACPSFDDFGERFPG